MKVSYELTISHGYICNAYIPSIIFMPPWTWNEQTCEKDTKGGKDTECKMHFTGSIFLTKWEVSTHEAIRRGIILIYKEFEYRCFFTGLKKNRTRMLKSINSRQKCILMIHMCLYQILTNTKIDQIT